MTSSWGVKSKFSTPVIKQIKLYIVASPIQLPFSLSDAVSVVHMLLYYRYIGRDNRITTWLCDRNQRNYSIFKMQFQLRIGHVDIGIMFLCIRNSRWCFYNTQSKSDCLTNTKSRALQTDWLILENKEKATLNINMSLFYEMLSRNMKHCIDLKRKIYFSTSLWMDMLSLTEYVTEFQNNASITLLRNQTNITINFLVGMHFQ